LKVILLAKVLLGLFILIGEIGPEARAEIDVPAPEAAQYTLGVLVIVSAELAGLAGKFLFSHGISFSFIVFPKIIKKMWFC
jgi:hypothetical protein